MLNLTVIGAAGRMGQALVRCITSLDDKSLYAAIDMPGHEHTGKDVGLLAGIGKTNIFLSESLDASKGSDVMIDFALHQAVPDHVRYASEQGIPMVIGTTGMENNEAEEIRKRSDQIPIVWAPNMSMGINLLLSLVQRTAESLPSKYAIELFETHHIHKKDAPSGTALKLAGQAAKARGMDPEKDILHEQKPENGKILIHSSREGEVVGDHSVVYKSRWEEITLSHHAISRDSFAMGAVQAAEWVTSREPGLYDMQDVLGL